MRSIQRLLFSDPHKAFVLLWHRLRYDRGFFSAAEEKARRDGPLHQDRIRRICDALLENHVLKAINLPGDSPLAVFQALDEYLFESDPSCGTAPRASFKVGDKSFFIYRRVPRMRGEVRHSMQAGHVKGWLKHHWFIPAEVEGIKITLRRLPRSFLPDELTTPGRALRFFVEAFGDGISPRWIEIEPPGWSTRALTDSEGRWRSLQGSLEQAAAEKADIVIFPELTLCPDLRRRVSQWLNENPEHPFSLILPGTFHEEQGSGVYNYGELFSRTGLAMLSHRKMVPYEKDSKPERIDAGNRIEILDTPLGLLAMPICLDFCDERSPFGYLWDDLGLDWILVPAFGNAASLSAHQRRAENLRRAHGTVSVVANQDPQGRSQHHGFICSPTDKMILQSGSVLRTFSILAVPPLDK